MDQQESAVASATSQTLSFTVPDGLDQALFACVQVTTNSVGVPSATYAGTPMIAAGYATLAIGNMGVALFYLADPPAGTATISASWPGTTGAATLIGAYLLSGVDETTPVEDFDTNTNLGTSTVTTTTATADAWLLGCGLSATTTHTVSGDLATEVWSVTSGSTELSGGHAGPIATPGNKTATYTVGSIQLTLELLAAIKPASAPADRLTFILDGSCTSGVGPCFEEASPTSGNPYVSANTDQIVLQNEAMRLSNKTLDTTNTVPFFIRGGCGAVQNSDVYCNDLGDTTTTLGTFDNEHSISFPFNVRCTNLRGQALGACTGSNNLTLKLLKNGSVLTGASDPACTFCSPGSGSDVCEDTARYVDYNAGDRYAAFFDEGATGIAPANMSWAMTCYKR